MSLRGMTGIAIAVVVALCGVTSGCGGSSNADPTESEAAAIAAKSIATQISEGALRKSPPELEVPPGLPPKKLVIKDLHKGTGKRAEKGDRVKIQYYGIEWNTGAENANSWHYEHIPIFTLGQHHLLRGLTIGIMGMREGGSREIIIPHNLVYYPGGHHRSLGVLDALIYKVYLVTVLD